MKPAKDNASGRTPVDWADVRARLQSAAERMMDLDAPNIDATRKILAERARKLAREPEAAKSCGTEVEVIEFVLANEHYAVESRFVREVSPLSELVALPGTPIHVRGIVHLRGHILAVIDLKRLFELPAKGLTKLARVVVLQSSEMEFGVLADELVGTRWLTIAELQPALPTLTGVRAEYLLGLGPERLVVLDAARLLADQRIVVNNQTSIQLQRR